MERLVIYMYEQVIHKKKPKNIRQWQEISQCGYGLPQHLFRKFPRITRVTPAN